MKIDVIVLVDDKHLFTANAKRSKIGPMNDEYDLTVNDAPFGTVTSCALCGITELVQRIVRYVLGDDGILKGEKSDA